MGKAFLVKSMRDRDTDELVSIYTENDKQTWPVETFEAIRTVLIERGVEVPLQREQAQEDKQEDKQGDKRKGKGYKNSGLKRKVLAIIVIGIGANFLIYKVIPSITGISMHLFVLIILTTGFIYCFKREKSSVIWMLLILPPILVWVAYPIFPYFVSRGRITEFRQFLVDTFSLSFSKALELEYIFTFILCWTVVIILESIVFGLLMWAKKSNNLDEKIFICTNCKAKVSENDMICPKCGANLDEIVK